MNRNGVILLNLVVPEEAFNIALDLAALGIISTWAMIVLCQIQLYRWEQKGILERPVSTRWSRERHVVAGLLLQRLWRGRAVPGTPNILMFECRKLNEERRRARLQRRIRDGISRTAKEWSSTRR